MASIVVPQAAASVHFVQVAHGYCAEHERIEHTGDAAASGPAALTHRDVLASAASSTPHHADECLHEIILDARATIVPQWHAVPGASARVEPARPHIDLPAHRPLSVAPKTSPPA